MLYCGIAEALKLAQSPVALCFTNNRPDEALGFAEGRWGCVMSLLNAAAQGKVTVLERKSGCMGGHIGMGFCEEYEGPPGGIEYFLSTGKGEGFPEGEGYRKTPELAHAFFEELPRVKFPYEYIVLKPLEKVDPHQEAPNVVVFLVNPDQLTALVVLANYGRPSSDNVIIPAASGGQSIGVLPYQEACAERQRAVVGTLDVSAPPFMKPDQLTFAVPYAMFQEMEMNVDGSFLDRKAWEKVRERIP
jgi:hypothetical protein